MSKITHEIDITIDEAEFEHCEKHEDHMDRPDSFFTVKQLNQNQKSAKLLRDIISGKPGIEISQRPSQTKTLFTRKEDGEKEKWKSKLACTKTHIIKETELNVSLVAQHAPEFRELLHYNSLSRNTEIIGVLPWQRPEGRIWTSEDSLQLQAWLQKRGMYKVKSETVELGVKHAALQRQFDPLTRYLESLKWDGTPRIDDWLTTYFGVDRNDYIQAIAPKVLIGAVARAFDPGCKMDAVLALEGPQGIGKSTAIVSLFGEDFVGDSIPDLGSKDAELQLQGKWCFEMAELTQLKRNELETVKAFISRTVDRYRAPYERYALDHPRRCIFIATTNEQKYLKDATGGRRFWPVECKYSRVESLKRDRDQLWAEACVRYLNGERWYLSQEEERYAAEEQGERYLEDAWASLIDKTLVFITENADEARVRVSDISNRLDLPITQQNALTQKRISDHLKFRGWAQKRTAKARFYYPPENWKRTVELMKADGTTEEAMPLDGLECVAGLSADDEIHALADKKFPLGQVDGVSQRDFKPKGHRVTEKMLKGA